ncbi:hypothetical protein Tco_0829069 [Tanacetum coccineum]
MENAQAESSLAKPKINNNVKIELSKEHLKELQNYAFSRSEEEDVVDHIAKVLEILDLIKIPNVDTDRLRVHVFPFSLTASKYDVLHEKIAEANMRHALTDRLRMVYTRAEGHVLFTIDTWRRLFKIWGPLVCRARRSMTWRVVPSYTSIRDPLMRLCHRLITVSISGRGQAPEKLTATDLFYLRSMDEGTAVDVPYLLAQYLIRHDEGRKRGARLSSKYFVGCLVEHFGLVTEEGLQGLIVVVGELQMVGIDELVRLRICKRFGDTLAWVASGLERQQADPVPVQAPEPPPAAAQSRTMPQKMAIVEKEVHGIRESLDEQCEVVDTMTIDFSKFNV